MSSRPNRSLQEWLHWFDIGEGSRWVRFAGLALGMLLLSCFVGYKQFRGPLTEATFAQAVVARQLAEGEGFTTLVNYPQSFAWAQETSNNGHFVNVSKSLPELHRAPLYSVTLGVALWITGARGEKADYVLLAVNVLLLWCAALQTFFLAKNLFGIRCGVIAMCALLLSAPVWAAAVAVTGATLSMVLWLALFQLILRARSITAREDGSRPMVMARRTLVFEPIGAGVICGLLFLCDYAALVALLVSLALICMRAPDWRRYWSLALVFAGFAVVASPWLMRNVAHTGNPLAFASQGIALKAGDPTADPAAQRSAFSTDAPALDYRKLGNKVLTAIQGGAGERFWSGGGLFLTAFFVAGFAYRFRNRTSNLLRWVAAAMLGALVLSQAFFDSGEGERTAWICMTPLIVVFGAAFFMVLLESSEMLAPRAGLVVLALLAAQALPLVRGVAAPSAAHAKNYPPYLPAFFSGLGRELARGRQTPVAWMCDVPAGAAWYSEQRVWARTATLDGVARASKWEPVRALVLTPETLGRPFFGELTKAGTGGQPSGWEAVYSGLVTGRMPAGFAISVPMKIAPDFYALFDPAMPSGKK